MTHEIRIAPAEFARLADGTKTFIVGNDRQAGYQKGDELLLREYDFEPRNSTSLTPKGYTDALPLRFRIGYVDNGSLILSLLPPELSIELGMETSNFNFEIVEPPPTKKTKKILKVGSHSK